MARRRWLLSAGLGLAALPALSQTPLTPVRKPGWWEMKIDVQGPTPTPIRQTMRICTDPAVDKAQSPFGVHAGSTCPPLDVAKTPTGWELHESCALAGMTISTSGHATGDLDSHYDVALVTHLAPAPTPQAAETHIAIDATWLGPCPAGKKPGDVEMTLRTNVAPKP
jgi:Protein of unknown function (DUF3617)